MEKIELTDTEKNSLLDLMEQEIETAVGKKALEFAILNAPQFGIKTLLGFIFSHNEPSLKLFQKFGFEEWENLPNIAKLDNDERGLKILGKRIAS